MNFFLAFFNPWTWRMAWRDSRSSRAKLLLFSSSIIIGIAALVAIGSFGQNLKDAVETQARGLLGADLVLTSRDPLTPEAQAVADSIQGRRIRETLFSSMVFFPNSSGTRLVQVRAQEPGFPFYGELETDPPAAAAGFHEGGALVEESLLIQFNAKVGDPVRVGELTLPIAGAVRKVPGETAVFATIAPRVFIPLARLPETKLVRDDSFARFKIYYSLPAGVAATNVVRELKPKLEEFKLGAETVEDRKRNLGRAMVNLEQFLNLGGFIALILGAIGVASAIHVHVRQKLASTAVLRCLGASVGQTFAIYLLQAMALGLFGAASGALLGAGVQVFLPRVMGDFLPFQLATTLVPSAIWEAMAIGFATCVLFALFPLVGLRSATPLTVLRGGSEAAPARDPARLFLFALLAGAILLFARSQTRKWEHAIGFTGGILGAFAILALVAKVAIVAARFTIRESWPYIWRQGMANLFRPNNRTLLLVLAIGLGTHLVLSMRLTQASLTENLLPASRLNQPNTALFDIQADQKEGIRAILKQQKLPLLQEVPIVTMRLAMVNGQRVADLAKNRGQGRERRPSWAFRREYRSTYRDTVDESEKTVAGVWPAAAKEPNLAPVSIEQDIAKDLGVEIGSKLAFDVQGLEIACVVAHIREVDWKRVQPNFFVVFASGYLEEAPAFNVVTTRVESREASAALQRAVVISFPNVSAIDLTLVLETVEAVLEKVAFVARFMAFFTIATGIIVLIASILTGKYQHAQETILLRTLGATRRQALGILLVEYLLLGLIAGLTGALLANSSSWALAHFLFEMPFTFSPLPSLIAVGSVCALTLATGLAASRGILDRPPLEVLRGLG